MKHDHPEKHSHCQHCVHECRPCDKMYCCLCPKEWGTACNRPHYDYYHIQPNTITYGSSAPGWIAKGNPIGTFGPPPDALTLTNMGDTHPHRHASG